ncbi:MAG: NAD(P)/FAD-dependent oxidoreductase [Bacteroidota bacterium]
MSTAIHTENLIIGAGPAGLAMAGRLTKEGKSYIILERSQEVAHSWHHHYDRLHLHTVSDYSHLPHQPFPADYPQYVPRKRLVEYYEQYARDMDIQPRFGEEVRSIKRAGAHWETTSGTGQVYHSDQVIVCTGFNRRVNRPTWPGMDAFKGKIMHSRLYKNGKPFENQEVLVVGMGNTGAEVSACLHEHGAQSAISVRGPVSITLRDLFGRPTQLTALKLAKLPHWLGDALGAIASRLAVGDMSKYGIPKPDVPPAKLLRTTGKTPVIDVGAVPLIKAGKIKIYPAIDHFDGEEVVFVDGRRKKFDTVILATGYKAALEDFIEDTTGIFNADGYPKAITVEEHPGLYFLGFDPYVAGGLLRVIYMDSERILKYILSHTALSSPVTTGA